jgi:hypothetical protein
MGSRSSDVTISRLRRGWPIELLVRREPRLGAALRARAQASASSASTSSSQRKESSSAKALPPTQSTRRKPHAEVLHRHPPGHYQCRASGIERRHAREFPASGCPRVSPPQTGTARVALEPQAAPAAVASVVQHQPAVRRGAQPLAIFSASTAIMLPITPVTGPEDAVAAAVLEAPRLLPPTGSGSRAGPEVRAEHRQLALVADRGARDQRLARRHAGGVHGEARAEVVAAIQHHVGRATAAARSLADQPGVDRGSPRCPGSARRAAVRRLRPWGGRRRRSVNSTWRCRLVMSTVSKSLTVRRPMPAAARYSRAGEPSPPAPITSAVASRRRACSAGRTR